jgi:hypothetical protein
MKLASLLSPLLAASFVFAVSVARADDNPPAFAGQPHINEALKHLNAAKEKVATDTNAALAELHAAHGDLSHAKRKKGTYQVIAVQLTDEAAHLVEAGDKDKATRKIDEAIANTTHAGETGER